MELKKLLKDLFEQIRGDATDKFLELLLGCMKLSFDFSQVFNTEYQKNIEGFNATYVFRSASGKAGATAVFADGDMKVKQNAVENGWTVRITFKNDQALRDFLFSRNQDILNSLLKNEVTAEGNLNYIYKFGYMARNLLHSLHLA